MIDLAARWDYSTFPLCGCLQTATMKDGFASSDGESIAGWPIV
jgi:hypothetical protein